ncbi:MAG: Eco57I restriction-modification methylase domain-containing protein [Bacillota bacterium]
MMSYKDKSLQEGQFFIEGRSLEVSKSLDARKKKGVFYTPYEIVSYMVGSILNDIDLAVNPHIKILDPACGAGYFLIEALNLLYKKFYESYDEIISCNPELQKRLNRDNIKRYIAENILYGADIDPEAVMLTKKSIEKEVGEICSTNIICCDSLIAGSEGFLDLFTTDVSTLEFWDDEFDYILGNPPYIGHKTADRTYKERLQSIYKDVYRDKSDIHYCFIKRSIDLLKNNGKLSFICSRYFLEGPSAEGLRRYILNNCSIIEIVDFDGYNVFADAGVASCILTLEQDGAGHAPARIKKLSYKNKKILKGSIMDNSNFMTFHVGRSMLKSNGWLLIPEEKYEVFKIIDDKSTHTLSDIFDSYQGIITGCDKAFIVSEKDIKSFELENSILKPWLKNSNIQKYKITSSNQYIIYSDLIENLDDYPNAAAYISRHIDKLVTRRECVKGLREWYKLQWGRKTDVFEGRKIVYPYKSDTNRFCVDDTGYFCSADVYSLKLKMNFENIYDYNYLSALLNSKTAEFYFKCFAKKISGRLYDYYPNTVMRIKIPAGVINPSLLKLAERIAFCEHQNEKLRISEEIDSIIYEMYGLSSGQIEIIEDSIK